MSESESSASWPLSSPATPRPAVRGRSHRRPKPKRFDDDFVYFSGDDDTHSGSPVKMHDSSTDHDFDQDESMDSSEHYFLSSEGPDYKLRQPDTRNGGKKKRTSRITQGSLDLPMRRCGRGLQRDSMHADWPIELLAMDKAETTKFFREAAKDPKTKVIEYLINPAAN